MTEMFVCPLSSWNTASVTQKPILHFNLKSYCTYSQWLPYWTAQRKPRIMAFVPVICSLSHPSPIAHSPYQLYLAGAFRFPGSLDNRLPGKFSERKAAVKTGAGGVEQPGSFASGGISKSDHLPSIAPACTGQPHPPHWQSSRVAFVSGLRCHYLLPMSLKL